MRSLWMLSAAALLTAGCGGKDDASGDDSEAKSDDSGVEESKAPDDSGEPQDDGELRPGAWLFTITSIITNTCGFTTTAGDVYPFMVIEAEDGSQTLDRILPIMYPETGSFGINGVELRQRDGGDCQTEKRVASAGTYTDWQTIDRYGRDENYVSTGAECEGWALNNGEDCRFEAVYTGQWVGDDFPEE